MVFTDGQQSVQNNTTLKKPAETYKDNKQITKKDKRYKIERSDNNKKK